ncbi:MAG TPA: PDZ domain-containing protein [Candidatus Baltobacteraceae bacterium]
MRLSLAQRRAPIYVAAALVAAALASIPTPYSLILPGHAVDLRKVVSVARHAPPAVHFYLTDVAFVAHATPLVLLDGLGPGGRIVRTTDVVPQGISSREYEGVMRESMNESQAIAAVVAERAAHLRVPIPRSHVLVLSISALSRAGRALRPGDLIVSVDGAAATASPDVARALARVTPGASVRVAILRKGRLLQANVPTILYHGATALGVYLTAVIERPRLPVAVTYHLPDVSGSSGGLMFALQIYATLAGKGRLPERAVAGTGTISYDGSVGPIEGAAQKIVAARRAGASLFLVPRENYAEIKTTSGIKVVPIANFRQAVAAIGR